MPSLMCPKQSSVILGLTYLAHTHIPSIWDAQNLWLDNIDWKREANALSNSRTLPNQVAYGMRLTPYSQRGRDGAVVEE